MGCDVSLICCLAHVASPTFASYLIVHIGAAFIFSCIQIRLIRCSWWNQYAHPLPFQIGSESRGGSCLSWRKNKDCIKNSCLWKKQFRFPTKRTAVFTLFLNSQIFHWVQIKTGRNWTQSLRELLSKVLRGESISILLVIQNQLSSKNRNREYVKLFLPGSTLPRPQRREPCPKQSPEESKMKLCVIDSDQLQTRSKQ